MSPGTEKAQLEKGLDFGNSQIWSQMPALFNSEPLVNLTKAPSPDVKTGTRRLILQLTEVSEAESHEATEANAWHRGTRPHQAFCPENVHLHLRLRGAQPLVPSCWPPCRR